MVSSPEYRVGVIGCGRAGTPRARAFDAHPSCKVTAIADTDPENLELTSGWFGVPGYGSYEEMFDRECIDIAVPILPVGPNADAVVAAAEAGVKAVFCEKPLTARLSDADRMVEACRSRGVHFGAGVMVSSHPDYCKAYALAASGEIGNVLRINLYETNSQGGCHGLNLVRKFARKADVQFVVGHVAEDPHSDHEEPYEDDMTAFGKIGGYIRFSNGIECFSSYGDVSWRGIEIIGTEGVIFNGNNTTLGLKLWKPPHGGSVRGFQDMEEVPGVFESYREEERGFDEEGWRDPGDVMRAIVDDIVNALETGADLTITTGEDLLQALEIAIALRESHRRGRTAVYLPIEDRSLVMYPEKGRWHYKKEIYGRAWYKEQMANAKRQ